MADNLTTATIDVRANTRNLEKDILKALKTVEFSEINTKKSSQALGRITGQVSEFNKSLEASNARVIAFGASAGAIFAVEKALSSLVSSTIEVEKKLTDINVLLNLSSSTLETFGGSLFDIAKNTAQSFSTVADAAVELARQGLGVEETLKRTNAALILTRLSGLDAKSSVEALTATLNSFSGSGLNAVEVVNKLANVDAAFAVSSADLANAISRVGSTAVDAGVSLDELIALVTSAQQTTARGGAVIGNSFKTIFTRLQRGKVQDLLSSLGIDTSEGQSAVSLLKQLATAYDTLGPAQKSAVAEQVGGVFQINILKAALSDLGKEYSIYGRALETSLSSTDEAIKRNQLLNQTVSALSSQAYANLEQAASKIGSLVFAPNAKGLLSGVNDLLSSFNNIDMESAGGKLMTGFFKGISSFIGGPGAILATAVLVKLFSKLAQFAAGSAKELLGTNKAAQQQAAVEQSILSILQKNSQFTNQILTGKMTTVQAEKELLNYLTAQSNVLREQEKLSKVIGANLAMAGVRVGSSGIPMVAAATKNKKAAAAGYVPNFASDQAIGQAMENSGAREHGYKAGRATKTTIHDGNGKSFKSFVNSKEDVVNFTNAAGKRATIVRPPNGFGKNTQYAAGGYVPNFVKIDEVVKSKEFSVENLGQITGSRLKYEKRADPHDTFQSDISIIRQKKSIDQYNRSAQSLTKRILKRDDKGKLKNPNLLGKKIKAFENAGVDGSAIKGLITAIENTPEGDKFSIDVMNRLKGIRGEIDASKMLGSKLTTNNAFFDLESGQEVKTRKLQPISELVKKSANQFLSNPENKIAGNKKTDRIKPAMSVVMPIDSGLKNASSGFVPNFASAKASDAMAQRVMDKFYGITDPKKFKEQYDIQSFKPAALRALYRERVESVGSSTLASRTTTANSKIDSASKAEVKDLGKLENYTMIHAGPEGYSQKITDYTKEDKKSGKKTKYLASMGTAGLNTKQLKGGSVQQRVGDALVTEANNLAETFNPGGGSKFSDSKQLSNAGSVFSAAGTVFESALRGAFDVPAQGQGDRIDFPNPPDKLRSFFYNAAGSYEAKISDTASNRSNALSKYIAVRGLSGGYVPNFAKSKMSFNHEGAGSNYQTLSASLGKKWIGDIAWSHSKYDPDTVSIDEFEVDKKERGKGYGGQLYKEAIKRNKGKKIKGQLLPQTTRLIEKINAGKPYSAETLYPQIKRADSAKGSKFEVLGHGLMDRDKFSYFILNKINELKGNPKKMQEYFGDVEADYYSGLNVGLITQHSSGFIPNFADRRVGYLDGDVLSDPKYASIVEEQIASLNIKGGVAGYHKYLGELANKSRGSGSLKKFTGIFGVPGAGKSSMMLGGKNSERADNSKSRKTQRVPIITPADINSVDEVIDTRASLVGTAAAIDGGYWSNLDRMMVLSSSTPKEQDEIKRRRGLRDSEISKGVSRTNFGREAGTSTGAGLDSAYIEAVALDILGPEKTRVMGINSNFGLKRKKEQDLPMVERKRLGLAYGAFSPSTKGHLEMMQMAKEKGISPEDFIVAVSREGGKLDEKDPHSLRTLAFDQGTRKYLAEKTFQGANVIGAGSDFSGGIRRHLEVNPAGNRRKFLSAQPGSTAFVGSDKQEKDFAKYKMAGYDVSVGSRTEGISGTKAREAMLSGDSAAMSRIFPEHVLPAINEISPTIKNRTEIIPEVMRRTSARIDKDLAPIEKELASLPLRITKTTPQDVQDKIMALRERRDKLKSQKQKLPPKILKRLSGMFPDKYGIPSSSSGFVPNFMDVQKGGLPFGVRGRMNYGSAGSKSKIQLGVGAEESTLAHELFHGAYSRSTVKNAQSSPSIGRFLSDPKKYAGVNSIFASSIFKGLNQKSLYSSLGLNPTQLDFDGKNPGATYSGSKAVDEMVTRIQEKVFKNKGNLDSLSGDEKTFVKNLEQQGLISDKRLSNVSRRSQEGSKFRNLVGSKFSSAMASSYSGFIPNFAKQKLADSPAFTNFYTDPAKPGVLEVGSIQNFEGPEQAAVVEKYLKNKITQLGIKQIDGGSTNLPPRYLKKYSQRLGVPISGYIGGDKFSSLSKKRQAAYDPYTTSKNIFGGREFNVKSGGFVPNFARFKSSPYFEEDGSRKRGYDGGKYISFGNGASREGMISLAKGAGLQFAPDGFPLKTKQNAFLFNKFLNRGQSERMSIYGEPDGGVHVKDGNHRLALGRYLGLKTFNNVDMKAQGFVPNFAAKVGMQKQRNALANAESGNIIAVHRIKPTIKDGRVSFPPSTLPNSNERGVMVHHLEGMSGHASHFPLATFLRLWKEREMDPRFFARNNFEWYYPDTEQKKRGLSSGFVPNFSAALNDAIAREQSSGLSKSQIYVDAHSSLKNKNNPMGLMVANRRDEPSGGIQGINRAKREGRNPKTYGGGMSSGFVPNFALFSPDQEDLDALKELNSALKAISEKIKDAADNFSVPDTENKVKKLEKNKEERVEKIRKGVESGNFFGSKEIQKSRVDVATAEQLKSQAQQSGNKSDIDAADKLLAEERKKLAKQEAALKAKIEARVRSLDEQIKAGKDSVVAYKKEQAALLEEKTSIESRRSSKVKEMGFRGRAKKFLGDNSMSLGFGLQSAASMAGEYAGNNDTKTGRGIKAAASGVGDIASFTGTGAMIAGAPGAIAGAAIGVAKASLNFIDALNTKVPDLEKALQTSSDSMGRFGESGQKLLQLNEQYADALSSGGDPSKTADLMAKTQQAYAEELSKLTDVQRASMISAIAQGKGQEMYAKVLEEMQQKVKSDETSLSLQKFVESSGVFGADQSLLKGLDQNLALDFTKGLDKNAIEKALGGASSSLNDRTVGSEAQALALMKSLVSSDSLKYDQQINLQKVIDAFEKAASMSDLSGVSDAFVKGIKDKPKAFDQVAEYTKAVEEEAKNRRAKEQQEIAIREASNARLLKLQADTDAVYRKFNEGVNNLISAMETSAKMRENVGEFKLDYLSESGANKNITDKQVEANMIQSSNDQLQIGKYTNQRDTIDKYKSGADQMLSTLTIDRAKLNIGQTDSSQARELGEIQSLINQKLLPIQGLIANGEYDKAGSETQRVLSTLPDNIRAAIGEDAVANAIRDLKTVTEDGNRSQRDLVTNSRRDLAIQTQQLVFQKAMGKLNQSQNYGASGIKDIIKNSPENAFNQSLLALGGLKLSGYNQRGLQQGKTNAVKGAWAGKGAETWGVDGKKPNAKMAAGLIDFYKAASQIGGESVLSTESKDFGVLTQSVSEAIRTKIEQLKVAGGGVVDPVVFTRLESTLQGLGGEDQVAKLKIMKELGYANISGKKIMDTALGGYTGGAFEGLDPELKKAFESTSDEGASATLLLVAGQRKQTDTLSQGLDTVAKTGIETNKLLSLQPQAIAQAIGAILEKGRAEDKVNEAEKKSISLEEDRVKTDKKIKSNEGDISKSETEISKFKEILGPVPEGMSDADFVKRKELEVDQDKLKQARQTVADGLSERRAVGLEVPAKLLTAFADSGAAFATLAGDWITLGMTNDAQGKGGLEERNALHKKAAGKHWRQGIGEEGLAVDPSDPTASKNFNEAMALIDKAAAIEGIKKNSKNILDKGSENKGLEEKKVEISQEQSKSGVDLKSATAAFKEAATISDKLQSNVLTYDNSAQSEVSARDAARRDAILQKNLRENLGGASQTDRQKESVEISSPNYKIRSADGEMRTIERDAIVQSGAQDSERSRVGEEAFMARLNKAFALTDKQNVLPSFEKFEKVYAQMGGGKENARAEFEKKKAEKFGIVPNSSAQKPSSNSNSNNNDRMGTNASAVGEMIRDMISKGVDSKSISESLSNHISVGTNRNELADIFKGFSSKGMDPTGALSNLGGVVSGGANMAGIEAALKNFTPTSKPSSAEPDKTNGFKVFTSVPDAINETNRILSVQPAAIAAAIASIFNYPREGDKNAPVLPAPPTEPADAKVTPEAVTKGIVKATETTAVYSKGPVAEAPIPTSPAARAQLSKVDELTGKKAGLQKQSDSLGAEIASLKKTLPTESDTQIFPRNMKILESLTSSGKDVNSMAETASLQDREGYVNKRSVEKGMTRNSADNEYEALSQLNKRNSALSQKSFTEANIKGLTSKKSSIDQSMTDLGGEIKNLSSAVPTSPAADVQLSKVQELTGKKAGLQKQSDSLGAEIASLKKTLPTESDTQIFPRNMKILESLTSSGKDVNSMAETASLQDREGYVNKRSVEKGMTRNSADNEYEALSQLNKRNSALSQKSFTEANIKGLTSKKSSIDQSMTDLGGEIKNLSSAVPTSPAASEPLKRPDIIDKFAPKPEKTWLKDVPKKMEDAVSEGGANAKPKQDISATEFVQTKYGKVGTAASNKENFTRGMEKINQDENNRKIYAEQDAAIELMKPKLTGSRNVPNGAGGFKKVAAPGNPKEALQQAEYETAKRNAIYEKIDRGEKGFGPQATNKLESPQEKQSRTGGKLRAAETVVRLDDQISKLESQLSKSPEDQGLKDKLDMAKGSRADFAKTAVGGNKEAASNLGSAAAKELRDKLKINFEEGSKNTQLQTNESISAAQEQLGKLPNAQNQPIAQEGKLRAAETVVRLDDQISKLESQLSKSPQDQDIKDKLDIAKGSRTDFAKMALGGDKKAALGLDDTAAKELRDKLKLKSQENIGVDKPQSQSFNKSIEDNLQKQRSDSQPEQKKPFEDNLLKQPNDNKQQPIEKKQEVVQQNDSQALGSILGAVNQILQFISNPDSNGGSTNKPNQGAPSAASSTSVAGSSINVTTPINISVAGGAESGPAENAANQIAQLVSQVVSQIEPQIRKIASDAAISAANKITGNKVPPTEGLFK